ncbi:MAG: alpha/beta fold hydrolase [Rhodoglobus sp.]|nr:alpha/beta fold hydrolase [Rhodoglobus sp.]
MRDTVTTVDGLSLSAETSGPDAAPAILAVHGFASTAQDNWVAAGWPRALEGYRLITFDLRGHGASETSPDPARYSAALLRADALAVLDHFGVERAHWLGYSLGARIGLDVARESPERIATLSLGGLPSTDPLSGALPADLVAGMQAPGRDPLALAAFAEGLRASTAPMQRAEQPTLLVTGDADTIATDPVDLAARLGAELVLLPGRTHSNAVSARAFKEAVVAFVGRH